MGRSYEREDDDRYYVVVVAGICRVGVQGYIDARIEKRRLQAQYPTAQISVVPSGEA